MENGVVRVALFLWLAVYVSCMNNTCTNINVTCEDLHMCGVEAVCISEPQAGIDTCNITTNFNESNVNSSGSMMWMCEYIADDCKGDLLSCLLGCSNYNCSNQSSVPDNTMTTTYTVSCVPTDTELTTTVAPTTTATELLTMTVLPTTTATVSPTTTATELPTTTVSTQLTSTITPGPQQPESTSATVSTTEMKQTTTSSGIMESTSVQSEQFIPSLSTTQLVLYGVLGFLLLLVLCVLIMILCVAACYCRRYRGKRRPTGMDMISKWEDTPDKSSDIQLVSVKSIGDSEDKDGEKKEKLSEAIENRESDEKMDESKDASKDEREKKEDDINLGTFGFPEVVIEPTSPKPQVVETEMKESDKDDSSEKKDLMEDIGKDKATVKPGDDSATDKKDAQSSTPDKQGVTESTSPKDKQSASDSAVTGKTLNVELKQKEKKLEPVPVHIPIFGKQAEDKKSPTAPSYEQSSADESDKGASPRKQEAQATESPTTNKEVATTDKVSKETETAAIAKPESQTVDSKTVVVSDKPPTDTGSLSLLSNEDIEKALGITGKDLGQDVSTQL